MKYLLFLTLFMATNFAASADLNRDVKIEALRQFEGTFGDMCLKVIGDETQFPPSGTPYSVSSSGDINGGDVAFNILTMKAGPMGFLVDHTSSMTILGIDAYNYAGGDRQFVFNIGVQVDGSSVSAVGTNESMSPKLSNICTSSVFPKAVGMNVWSVFNKFFPKINGTYKCIDTKLGAFYNGSLKIAEDVIVFDGESFSSAGSISEQINILDSSDSNQAEFSYTNYKDGIMFTLKIKHNGKILDLSYVGNNNLKGCTIKF